MKTDGVNNLLSFRLNEDTPIFKIKGGKADETEKKLLKNTVVDGKLKTRIITVDREKEPFKVIELANEKGYISPHVVSLYLKEFENINANDLSVKKTPVRETSNGEKSTSRKSRAKNIIINYGLPATGAFVGYKVAKKMGSDTKKTIGLVLFFTVLGFLPKYIHRKN